jgi:hypothetical protein
MKEKKSMTRFIGIDLGKRTYAMATVAKGGKAARSNGRTDPEGRQRLYRKLKGTDKVAFEAGTLVVSH